LLNQVSKPRNWVRFSQNSVVSQIDVLSKKGKRIPINFHFQVSSMLHIDYFYCQTPLCLDSVIRGAFNIIWHGWSGHIDDLS